MLARREKATRLDLRRLLSLLAGAWLAVGVAACGSAATHSISAPTNTTTASTTATTNYAEGDADKDNDIGASQDDTNNDAVLRFGRPATAAEKRAIETLVKRYYATALAGNGTKGCSMIYSTLAETVAEDYAVPGGPTYLRGTKDCQTLLAALFSHFHRQLAVEVPKLKVAHVLIKERHGMTVLSFAELPERELPVTREGHTWKIAALLDSELP